MKKKWKNSWQCYFVTSTRTVVSILSEIMYYIAIWFASYINNRNCLNMKLKRRSCMANLKHFIFFLSISYFEKGFFTLLTNKEVVTEFKNEDRILSGVVVLAFGDDILICMNIIENCWTLLNMIPHSRAQPSMY